MAQLDETIAVGQSDHIADHEKLATKANYVFDVTDYGATGDGVTDDGDAIRTAIAAAGRGWVYYPPGTYNHATAITGGDDGIIHTGAGGATVIHNTSSSGGHGFVSPAGIRKYTLQNMALTGVTGGGSGFFATADFGGIQLVNLKITDVGDNGVDLSEGTGVHTYLRQVRVDRAGGVGFDLDATGNTSVNTVVANASYANNCGEKGWKVGNVGVADLVGCSADNNAEQGFYLSGKSIAGLGCTAEGNTTAGFELRSSTGKVTLINCRTNNQVAPFYLKAPTLDCVLVNHVTTSTPSGLSVNVDAACTGEIVVVGGVSDASDSFAGNVTLLRSDLAGFYGTTPIAQQTGVAVSAAGIHAALVSLGLITA